VLSVALRLPRAVRVCKSPTAQGCVSSAQDWKNHKRICPNAKHAKAERGCSEACAECGKRSARGEEKPFCSKACASRHNSKRSRMASQSASNDQAAQVPQLCQICNKSAPTLMCRW